MHLAECEEPAMRGAVLRGDIQSPSGVNCLLSPPSDATTAAHAMAGSVVLEGVTTARFEQEFLTRPQGYYAHVRDRSVYFDEYHTTNLDSYTSLIAMLTSVQVPYRAYADPSS
jgi:hypothetical protein